MASERSYVSYATAAVAVAAIPLSFVGPEGLRLAVIGLLMLAGPGTALVLLLRFEPPALGPGHWRAPPQHRHRNRLQPRDVHPRGDGDDLRTALVAAGGVCILSIMTLAFLGFELKRPKQALVRAK